MWDDELSQAKLIAREAGEILLEVYATDFAVDFKDRGHGDPVTLADRRANAHIVARLRALFPADAIIAEESENGSEALSRPRIWYVDPLDGTKEFIAKNGEFSVMIGLALGPVAQLGVVYAPTTGKLYSGVVGQAAWLELGGAIQTLRVSEIDQPADLSLIVSRSHRPRSTEELVQRLGIRSESTSGSVGLKVGLIAERAADLYVHMSDKSSAWDTCAPAAILLAAGGRFTDLAGEPIRYAQPDLRTRRGILACNAKAFDAVLPVVRELGTRAGLLGAPAF
jgi:3'(2'), 5'-bisphosphate nucleotidase